MKLQMKFYSIKWTVDTVMLTKNSYRSSYRNIILLEITIIEIVI